MNSLADQRRKEKMGGRKRGEVSHDTLDHLVSVLESWKEDEEGLLVCTGICQLIQSSCRGLQQEM